MKIKTYLTILTGRSVCSFIDCEHLLGCKNTVTLPKTCCPVCKGNFFLETLTNFLINFKCQHYKYPTFNNKACIFSRVVTSRTEYVFNLS